jgi:hypothetical protein
LPVNSYLILSQPLKNELRLHPKKLKYIHNNPLAEHWSLVKNHLITNIHRQVITKWVKEAFVFERFIAGVLRVAREGNEPWLLDIYFSNVFYKHKIFIAYQ